MRRRCPSGVGPTSTGSPTVTETSARKVSPGGAGTAAVTGCRPSAGSGGARRQGWLIEAWSPQEFREQYRPFTEKFLPWVERLDAGTVSPAEAFRVRTELMDAWRAFPWSDPDLPAELLPEAWPRSEARDLLVRLYDGLAPAAMAYVEEAVVREVPELAGTARTLSVKSAV
jgi:DNA-binding transcriptional regulator PaaX